MSVLIKCKELPKSGIYEVSVDNTIHDEAMMCIYKRKKGGIINILGGYKLIRVSPHGRLIDADKLMKDIAELEKSPWYNCENHAFYKEAIDIIKCLCVKKALTVIEAEEVEK